MRPFEHRARATVGSQDPERFGVRRRSDGLQGKQEPGVETERQNPAIDQQAERFELNATQQEVQLAAVLGSCVEGELRGPASLPVQHVRMDLECQGNRRKQTHRPRSLEAVLEHRCTGGQVGVFVSVHVADQSERRAQCALWIPLEARELFPRSRLHQPDQPRSSRPPIGGPHPQLVQTIAVHIACVCNGLQPFLRRRSLDSCDHRAGVRSKGGHGSGVQAARLGAWSASCQIPRPVAVYIPDPRNAIAELIPRCLAQDGKQRTSVDARENLNRPRIERGRVLERRANRQIRNTVSVRVARTCNGRPEQLDRRRSGHSEELCSVHSRDHRNPARRWGNLVVLGRSNRQVRNAVSIHVPQLAERLTKAIPCSRSRSPPQHAAVQPGQDQYFPGPRLAQRSPHREVRQLVPVHIPKPRQGSAESVADRVAEPMPQLRPRRARNRSRSSSPCLLYTSPSPRDS